MALNQSCLYNIKILINFIHKCDGTNINNAHSVYFLVMFTLLVKLHVNLELSLEHTGCAVLKSYHL